jgi:hypothetical protein
VIGAALLSLLIFLLVVSGAPAIGGTAAETTPTTAPPTTTAPTTRPATAPAADAVAAAGDATRVHGVVMDPAGKPVGGARVAVVLNRPEPNLPSPEPLTEARTGPDGRFDLSFRKPDPRSSADAANFPVIAVPTEAVINFTTGRAEAAGPQVMVVVSAEGYGPAWARTDAVANGIQLGPTRAGEVLRGEFVFRLVPDRPIEARILDLEGRPVAGVNVNPYVLMAYVVSEPAPAIRATSNDNRDPPLYQPSASTGATPATSNADGRFRITGLGADRTVLLHFDSSRVALPSVQVITRNEVPPARIVYSGNRVYAGQQYYGAKSEFFAAPARSLVGTVRDADTHRPLAGVKVLANSFPGSRREAVTDAQGQFRIDGLPKGQNRLQIAPPADRPYFAHDRIIDDQPGIGVMRLDIDLHRGVWITGRVTDKTTGDAVAALVQYAPFLSNKYASIPEYQVTEGVRFVQGSPGRGTTAADGTYRVVGLPGAGVVAVVARDELYPKGQGADQIKVKDPPPVTPDPARPGAGPSFGTYQRWMGPASVTAVRGVELASADAADVKPAQVDFQLDGGNAVEITMSGPPGKTVSGAWVVGDHSDGALSRIQGETFKAVDFGDDENRLLVLRDVDGSLGKVVAVRLPDVPRRRLRVRLEPAAKVTGRVVDADGKPVGSTSVRAETAVEGLGDRQQRRVATASTQTDGHFQLDLFAGCDYSLTVETDAPGGGTVKGRVGRFAIEPGDKKDLGDVRVADKVVP